MKNLFIFVVCVLSATVINAQEEFRVPVDVDEIHRATDNCCEFGFGQYCGTRGSFPCTIKIPSVANNYAASKNHNGLDYEDKPTTSDIVNGPIYASGSGRVIMVRYGDYGSNHRMGNVIAIEHVLSSGEMIVTLYAHLKFIYVNQGDIVTKGQTIGFHGSTGTLTATSSATPSIHLHFEMKQWYDHTADGIWGVSSSFSEYFHFMANPVGTSACCFGYTPVDQDQSSLGFLDPQEVLENDDYQSIPALSVGSLLRVLDIQEGETFEGSVAVMSNFTGTWTGQIYLELLNADGSYRGDLGNQEVTWTGNDERNIVTFERDSPITSPAGDYLIRLTFSNGESVQTYDKREIVSMKSSLTVYENPMAITVEGEPIPVLCDQYVADMSLCNRDDWDTNNGDWYSCNSLGYSYGYLRQTDEDISNGYAYIDEDIDVSSYDSYKLESTFELEGDNGDDDARIYYRFVDGYVRFDFGDQDIKLRYGGSSQYVDYALQEDEQYTVNLYCYPDKIVLFLNNEFIAINTNENDWDDDDFGLQTRYADAKFYDFSLKFYGTDCSAFSAKSVDGSVYTKSALEYSDEFDNISSSSLVVYPNPSDGVVYFVSEDDIENAQLTIHDMRGVLIVTDTIEHTERYSLKIDTAGMYFYRIVTQDGNIYTGKIIIK